MRNKPYYFRTHKKRDLNGDTFLKAWIKYGWWLMFHKPLTWLGNPIPSALEHMYKNGWFVKIDHESILEFFKPQHLKEYYECPNCGANHKHGVATFNMLETLKNTPIEKLTNRQNKLMQLYLLEKEDYQSKTKE